MQQDQIRLILNVVFKFCVFIVMKKNGYRIINVITNSRKNQDFQIGANIDLISFKESKVQNLEI